MDKGQNFPKVESLIDYRLRDIFKGLVKKENKEVKYLFLTDDPFFAENLISENYLAVFITKETDPNSFTVDEFYDFIIKFGETPYATDYFYIPICARARNEELCKILKDRECKYSRSGWQPFSRGADYFQSNIDELKKAAQRAIDKINGKKNKEKPSFTDDGQTKYVTIDNLTSYLQSKGILTRYNEINHNQTITGLDPEYGCEHSQDILPVFLYNELRFIYDKCTKGDIRDFLNLISIGNRYNPVLDMVNALEWDGTDRLPQLYDILYIMESDQLSKTLIAKWLHQCLSMARNVLSEQTEAYGGDGVLTLVGTQGIGKTSFFRKLAVKQDFFYEGKHLNFNDKDTLIRATSAWITELGEIGSTLRGDIDKLKAFVTDKTDMYRRPYGHGDMHLARHTSFCATCNDKNFLIDPTGNRRFWSVPVDQIDLEALDHLDILQLWAQIDAGARNNPQGFRLTQKEQKELAARNQSHEKPLKGEEEVRDILNMARRKPDIYAFKPVTVTEFIQVHDALKKYSSIQIGKVLNKIEIELPESERVDGVVKKLRLLPVWKEGRY